MLTTLVYSLLALDQTIATLAMEHGPWMYALLALTIFAETGLVVLPFLPGDSLLFLGGTVVAASRHQRPPAGAALAVAAILGDSVNYSVGRYIGPRVFSALIHAGSARTICGARRSSTIAMAA